MPNRASPQKAADDCSICLEELGSKPVGKLNKCVHRFCFLCIKEWAQKSNACPVCRKRFTRISQVSAAGAAASSRKPKANAITVRKRDFNPDAPAAHQDPDAEGIALIDQAMAFLSGQHTGLGFLSGLFARGSMASLGRAARPGAAYQAAQLRSAVLAGPALPEDDGEDEDYEGPRRRLHAESQQNFQRALAASRAEMRAARRPPRRAVHEAAALGAAGRAARAAETIELDASPDDPGHRRRGRARRAAADAEVIGVDDDDEGAVMVIDEPAEGAIGVDEDEEVIIMDSDEGEDDGDGGGAGSGLAAASSSSSSSSSAAAAPPAAYDVDHRRRRRRMVRRGRVFAAPAEPAPSVGRSQSLSQGVATQDDDEDGRGAGTGVSGRFADATEPREAHGPAGPGSIAGRVASPGGRAAAAAGPRAEQAMTGPRAAPMGQAIRAVDEADEEEAGEEAGDDEAEDEEDDDDSSLAPVSAAASPGSEAAPVAASGVASPLPGQQLAAGHAGSPRGSAQTTSPTLPADDDAAPGERCRDEPVRGIADDGVAAAAAPRLSGRQVRQPPDEDEDEDEEDDYDSEEPSGATARGPSAGNPRAALAALLGSGASSDDSDGEPSSDDMGAELTMAAVSRPAQKRRRSSASQSSDPKARRVRRS